MRTLRLFLLITLLGFFTRVTLILTRQDYRQVEHAEIWQIAHSLATRGAYADPFGGETGPTAQQMPLLPIYTAFVQRLAGSEIQANLIMELSASLASSMQYALLPLIGVELGVPLLLGIAAAILGSMFPLHYWIETKGSWDAPFTGLGLACATWWVLRLLRTGVGARQAALLGLLWGGLTLLTACALPVLAGYNAILFARVPDPRSRLRLGLLACSVFACSMLPWVIRNELALKSFQPVRTNLGLELHLSNHDGVHADANLNIAAGYQAKMHPFNNPVLQARVRELGEVEFSHQERSQALQWIKTHPAAFLDLCVQRALLFWFPYMRRWWQTAIELSVRILAFGGLAFLWRANVWRGLIFAWLWISFSFIYYFVQSGTARYAYPLWWSQVLLTLVALVGITEVLTPRRETRSLAVAAEPRTQ